MGQLTGRRLGHLGDLGGVFLLFSFVCSKSGHVLEVDYKHVYIRSARRLLPSQQQDQQGGGAGRALAGRRGNGAARLSSGQRGIQTNPW